MKTAASPHVLPHLPIDRSSKTPLHRQVYDGLRKAILDGMLRPGQRVPSTRALAAELEISRLPVLTAYEQLLHEGYVEGRSGSGTFVSAAPPDSMLRARPVKEAPTTAPSGKRRPSHRRVPLGRDEGGIRPFRLTLPALDQFPHELWSRLVARHARRLAPIHMAYGDPAGVGALRAAIADHLRTSRAVRCEPEQILIVSGSQAALRVCAASLFRHGDRVAIEEPGYPGAHAAIRASGAALVPVPVDDEGIDVDALSALRTRISAIYVTPSHQYPLGASMSAARRLALLEWAARREVWILEDDYDSEYRYVSRPLGALQGLDTRDRVVYIGTFSKVLFPALRVGYIVVPRALWETFLDSRDALDVFSPTLYQLVLAEFLHEGHFVRHLRRMRGVYVRRRDAIVEGLMRHCADFVSVPNADAGLHVAALLSGNRSDVALLQRMATRGLTGGALSKCYIGPTRRNGLLLGFGGFDERTLMAATKTLGEVLRA
jgi:GntR family transcriptional regulator/MocR family aminotransferase